MSIARQRKSTRRARPAGSAVTSVGSCLIARVEQEAGPVSMTQRRLVLFKCGSDGCSAEHRVVRQKD